MNIKDLEKEINQLTVAEIATKTEKTERSVKVYLTRNGLSCLDYNGENQKAASIQRLAAEEERVATEKEKSEIEKREIEKQAGRTAANAVFQVQEENDNLFKIISILFGVVWFVLTVWGFSENGAAFFLVWLLMSFVIFMACMMTWSLLSDRSEKSRLKRMSAIEQSLYKARQDEIRTVQNEIVAKASADFHYGLTNANLVCTHCQTKGNVRSKSKEEVTSTKVVPIIGNNIKSRKKVTQMHCDNCDTTWNV